MLRIDRGNFPAAYSSGFGGKQSMVFSISAFTTQSTHILKIPIIVNSMGPRKIFFGRAVGQSANIPKS